MGVLLKELAVELIFVFCCAASVSLGAADAAIEAVREHLGVRKQFGKYLKEFQVGHNLIKCNVFICFNMKRHQSTHSYSNTRAKNTR